MNKFRVFCNWWFYLSSSFDRPDLFSHENLVTRSLCPVLSFCFDKRSKNKLQFCAQNLYQRNRTFKNERHKMRMPE